MSGPNPAYDPENIFAKIIDGKIPSSKIFETDDVRAKSAGCRQQQELNIGRSRHTSQFEPMRYDSVRPSTGQWNLPHHFKLDSGHCEKVLAILDAFPMAPGHSLLMPKEKGYITIMDMPADKVSTS